ncbi:flagellar biosynthesis protein FlhA [Geminicoccaceae bacterium 1502E]|nr:flagellar biosynthesis protein FlhA [Geminicoccaceae bacterium 1502E]
MNQLALPAWLASAANTLRSPDILFALFLVGVLVTLILPVPALLLDVLLAVSITFSVVVLLTTLFIEKPLEFNAFPTVLLIATMLRLALNLASTRLILAHGHEGPQAAGQVIQAFGGFVMQDNFVIGVIVFAILVVVNFVVITKGSGRIAEVAARFSLDAMPGKQMAIDADLSAGLIDEATARARRSELEAESSFFGAMDGAAKFVRGDAVAGLLITGINLAGGLVVGIGQMGLDAGEASRSYTLLTVGDGLVSQIPALIVSMAAGLLVSKAGVTGRADRAVLEQLGGRPRVLALAAGLMAVLALLPGLPALPFLLLAGGAGWLARRPAMAARSQAAAAQAPAPAPAPAEEPPTAPRLDPIRLEIGYGLLSMVGDGAQAGLPAQIRALRRQLAGELGFVLPSVRIQDNIQLPGTTYVVRVKETEAGRGELRPAMLMVMDPAGAEIGLPGEPTVEPTFGLPAMWISPALREEALGRGLTVVDPGTVVTTHLTEIVRENLPDLLTFPETQKLLHELGEDYQKLLADIVPARLPPNALQRVLQALLAERVSIRDLPLIVEAVAEAALFTQSLAMVVEHVRSRLARQISLACTGPAGHVPVVTLSAEWEHALLDSLSEGPGERQLALAPSRLQEFATDVRECLEARAREGELPVVLCTPQLRPHLRAILERLRPSTIVLSHNEIHPKTRIRTLGQI